MKAFRVSYRDLMSPWTNNAVFMASSKKKVIEYLTSYQATIEYVEEITESDTIFNTSVFIIK